MPPNASVVAAAAASTAAASTRSTTAVCTRSFGISSRAALARSLASRSHSDTRAPEASRRSATARPMPCAPPVMTARRPPRSIWFMPPYGIRPAAAA